ncbi:MAG: twin-arginine translocase TatA/TatE family subunit [Actinomycetota bacterium]|jgi:sec-independent protein translocase protein TatA|nr:twin-arginine translocase TatA/TatE family subunit [Rubrobacter sp.]MDQ3238581.1 twin-arginine translocase TatA/TatE family subunit [Actinomycetota bacterium]MDQ3567662.1 twin-arginine translocase TatA/TatE family subunit [Actinomycetota bacterium]
MGLALIPGIGSLGGTELIIALVIILLLFGAKRIPELARGLGSGVREFRQGTREGQLEDKKEEEKNEQDKKDEEDLASTEVKSDDTVDASADASAQPDASVETDSTEQKHR